MKKLLLVAVAGMFVLASCKKDYTCTCTEDGVSEVYPIKGAKKKDAEKVCDTWTALYTADGGTCTLK